MPSIRGSIGERSSGEADTSVGSIIHAVEPLKKRQAVDEIQTLARRSPDIGDDEVDAASVATNRGVQRPRPDLRVGSELELDL